MLSAADIDIEYAMSELAQYGLEAGYLVPTATGLQKGILDAHESLRRFLLTEEIHDYTNQAQGVSGKVTLEAELRTTNSVTPTRVSLYRPETKGGDPRIWVYGLPQAAVPGNVLAILPPLDGKLQVLLISNLGLDDVSRPETSIGEAVAALAGVKSGPANDLLGKLRSISREGFVPTMREGSTGIGFTLESLLGIAANSSRSPDYRGIEIKASRSAAPGKPATRVNLFAKTPDWNRSRLKSSRDLLDTFGYTGREGLSRLSVTVRNTPNAQGLHFALPDEETLACGTSEGSMFMSAVVWSVADLESALMSKHRETFWVEATARMIDGVEHFHYDKVIHSRDPLPANFTPLAMNGTISMDFTIKERANGTMKDHGYLFKVFPESRHMLIPNALTHSLP